MRQSTYDVCIGDPNADVVIEFAYVVVVVKAGERRPNVVCLGATYWVFESFEANAAQG